MRREQARACAAQARWMLSALVLLGLANPVFAQPPSTPLTLPPVEVISTSLLPGLGMPLHDVPANVQRHEADALKKQGSATLADFLSDNATSVNVNAAQGNPFQPDVNFRGFTASPLLGVPQGLSVFVDGVRVNEPFGDVVNWDLIPASAIASTQVIPGSNPIYGLNTLGGALSVHTKSGLTHPGGSVQMTGGAFGRAAVEFQQGDSHQAWNYFLSGNLFNEKGWGKHNASQVRQFFGRLGHKSGQSSMDGSLTLTDNSLEGSQTLPLSYADDIRQAYTHPDLNRNRLAFLNFKGSHAIGDALIADGNVYYRRYDNRNLSSNVNDAYDGVTVLNPATLDRSAIVQDSYGLGLQLTHLGELAGRANQFVTGLSADLGAAVFTQEVQDADFTVDRGAVGTGPFVPETHAQTNNGYYGLFASNSLSLDARWVLTLSGRYNLATVRIADLSGTAPELNGDHSFTRFNPAVGVNFKPSARWTGYAVYNEGMRAPTPIELTCADPAAPCKLPNSFLADPPLQMVIARTVELGARGHAESDLSWSAAAYRTSLQDDIQFISSGGLTNAGYFQNTGDTLRQGIELAVERKTGVWQFSARYSHLDASYQSAFVIHSPANSSADASGDIQVRPGDRIPGLPRHVLKLRIERGGIAAAPWSVGASLHLSSDVYARGDENNQDINGTVPGFAVVNLDTRYQPAPGFELFARINNLFDRRYANFGTLGENFFPNGSYDSASPVTEQFRGHGAPRGVWAGLRYQWK